MESQKVFAAMTDGGYVDLSQIAAFCDSRYIPMELYEYHDDDSIIDLCESGKKTSPKTVIFTCNDRRYIVEEDVKFICQIMRKNGFKVSD